MNFSIVWSALHLSVTVLVLVLFLQGRGSQAFFVVLFFSVPLIRLLTSPSYRKSEKHSLIRHWENLKVYAANPLVAPPYRSVFWFVVLPTLCLCLLNGRFIISNDNLPTNLTSVSLALWGTTEVTRLTKVQSAASCKPEDLPYSLRCTPHGVLSNYQIGPVLVALPTFLLARLLGADLQNTRVQWQIAKWIAAWIAALSVGFLFFVSLQFGSPQAALWVALFLASGSAILSTIGQALWSHDGVVLCLCLMLFIECHTPYRQSKKSVAVQGALIAMMLCCRLTSATFICPFFVWKLFREPKKAVQMGIAAFLFFIAFATYNVFFYQNFLGPQLQMGASVGHWGRSFWQGFTGILFSPGRGLFIYQPWIAGLLIAAFVQWPGVSRLNNSRFDFLPRHWKIFCVAAICFQVALVSIWPLWSGGYCLGSRLLSETMPLWALLAVAPVQAWLDRRGGKKILVALAVLSFSMQFNGVYCHGDLWDPNPLNPDQPMEERVWDWSDPPFLYPIFRKNR